MISHVPVPPLDPAAADRLPRTFVFERISVADGEARGLGTAAGDANRAAR
jgi:hypothetical protein